MIVNPGLIPTIPEYGSFFLDPAESILTTSRKYDSYWVNINDKSEAFGPLTWTPILLPANGCDNFGGSIDLPGLTTQSWAGTSTFKLLDKDGNTLWTMISTLTYDVSYDVSAYPPATLIDSHGSISNAYPDGLSYSGIVNGYSVNTEWTPADEDTTPPYFSNGHGTFLTLPILYGIPNA